MELGTLLDETDENYTKVVGVKMESFGYGIPEAPEILFMEVMVVEQRLMQHSQWGGD